MLVGCHGKTNGLVGARNRPREDSGGTLELKDRAYRGGCPNAGADLSPIKSFGATV